MILMINAFAHSAERSINHRLANGYYWRAPFRADPEREADAPGCHESQANRSAFSRIGNELPTDSRRIGDGFAVNLGRIRLSVY